MEFRGDILTCLRKVKLALQQKDYVKIKNQSNHIIHGASISQNPDIISVAVILYALSKLIERETYKTYKAWPKFYKNYSMHIDHALSALEKKDMAKFRQEISEIRTLIKTLSGRLQKYIKDVFRKAQINKASRLYEHGISMSKTAKILGISVWELAEYAGGTGIADVNLAITMPIEKRVKLAERIFSK
jgi:hypothetical protein